MTLLFRRLPFTTAQEAVNIIHSAVAQGYLNLEWISPARFEKAKQLRLKLKDKPEISFTDLTSMTVMNELGLDAVLTDDDHFLHIGSGFNKVP